jgi:Pyruvate/2-oxoacid:ferredoxin oxidoreductase delta subunit
MSFLPKNLHILVIDDKIGGTEPEFKKFTQYFDHRLKCCLKRKMGSLDNFEGEIFIHYLDTPAKLESRLLVGSDYKEIIPIDVILLDINFERLGKLNVNDEDVDIEAFNSLTSSFLYEGKKFVGFAIYRYLKYYYRYGISSIPKIIISGDTTLLDFIGGGKLENISESYQRFFTDEFKKKELDNSEKFDKDLFEKHFQSKQQDNWIEQTADKAFYRHSEYFKNIDSDDLRRKTEHLIHRLQNEYHFFRMFDLNINKNEFLTTNSDLYPQYEFEISGSKLSDEIDEFEKKIIIKTKSGDLTPVFKGLLGNDKKKIEGEFKLSSPKDLGDNWFSNLYSLYTKMGSKNRYYKPESNDLIGNKLYYGKVTKATYAPKIDEKICNDCKSRICENYINSHKCDGMKYHVKKKCPTILGECIKCELCLKNIDRCSNGAIKKGGPVSNDTISFGGKEFENRVFLAATPVTAFSGIGKNDFKKKAYINKIEHLYAQGKPGGIILKTVYMEEDDNSSDITEVEKIEVENIRELNVARCYRESQKSGNRLNLYNTGKTANENIDYTELRDLLIELNTSSFSNNKSLIISLGSHSYGDLLWEKFFETIFLQDSKIKIKINEVFDFIEINARHSMRKISQDCSAKESNDLLNPYIFGVDEYFISPDLSNYTGFWKKFEEWIETIHKLGIKYEKFLMIKLPYRSDLNMLIYIIRKIIKKVNKEEYGKEFINGYESNRRGITAISAINTIKSPYSLSNLKIHKDLNLIADFNAIPQTSGNGLTQLRNITLYTLSNICGSFCDEIDGLDISASGGIMSEDDIYHSISLGAKTVQISSWYLLEGFTVKMDKIPESEGDESNFYFNTMQLGKIPRRKIKFIPERCLQCGKCTNTYYCDAIVNKFIKGKGIKKMLVPNSPIINEAFCSGCGMCASVCDSTALVLEYENAIKIDNTDEHDGAPVPKSALLNENKCPICCNKESHIFVYPLETINTGKLDQNKEKLEWRQYYYCSKCSVLFSYIRKKEKKYDVEEKKTLKIEALIDIDIKIDENESEPLSPKYFNKGDYISVKNGVITSYIPHFVSVGFKNGENEYIKIGKTTNSNVEIINKIKKIINNKTEKKRIYHSIHGDRKDILNKPIKITFE